MNLWAVEYEYRGELRCLLVETPDTVTISEINQWIHPAILGKPWSVTFIGEVYSV